MQISKFFSPDPVNDGTDPKHINDDKESLGTPSDPISEKHSEDHDGSEHKSFKTSLRDALQEWSNDDARDIEEDDSTPMRSGL